MLLAHLIQAGYYGHPSGFFYGMSAGTMGSWILIIVIGIVGWIVQARLQSVFAKYARVPFPGGLTGAEVAEKMLRDNGIRNVKVIAGMILLATTDNAWVCWIGVGLIAVSALFSIVTLPVEYNASERALAWLESSRTMQGAELAQAREALTWAARTYRVAALSAIATVLYYAMLILGRGNNRD